MSAVFEQHILACDTDLRRTVLNVRRDVRGTHDNNSHFRVGRADDQLARSLRVFDRRNTGRGQQGLRFIENSSLGKCERDQETLLVYATASPSHVSSLT